MKYHKSFVILLSILTPLLIVGIIYGQNHPTNKLIVLKSLDYEGQAITIGNNIKAVNDSCQLIKDIKLSEGKLFEIIGKTNKKYQEKINDDPCEKYPYIKIKDAGKNFWVLGKYIYQLKKRNTIKSFRWREKEYDIYTCKNFSIGASDKEGLTGCDEYLPIVLNNITDKTYSLIKSSDDDSMRYPKIGYYFLLNDEGAGEEIIGISIKDGCLQLHISATYQEDSATYDLKISYKSGKYSGQIINYLRKG